MKRIDACRMWTVLFGIAVLALAASSLQAADAPQSKVEQAVEQSRATGKPILVVMGAQWCGPCSSLKHQLAGGSLRKLAEQYVYLPIDVDRQPNMLQRWKQKFRPREQGVIPHVHIVRWDGATLYDSAGVIGEATLVEYLKPARSGKRLSAEQLADIQQAAEEAEKLLADGKTSDAIEKIADRLGSGGAGAAAARIESLGMKLDREATEKFNAGKSQLDDETGSVDGALAMLRAIEIYGRLPSVAPLKKQLDALRDQDSQKTLFAQAEAINAARQLVDLHKTSEAITALESVVRSYPNTPAARIAQHELAAIGG